MIIENNSSTAQPLKSCCIRPGKWEMLFLLLALLLTCWHFLLLPLGLDQGIYAVNARRMLEGWALYSGAWDMKGPGIFFVYLPFVAAGGDKPWPVFAGSMLCAYLVIVAMYRLAAGPLGKPAAWFAVLFYLIVISTWGDPIVLGQPDEWLTPLLLWSLILMDEAWQFVCQAKLRALCAGLMMGAVILLRPPFIPGAIMLVLLWIPLPGCCRKIFCGKNPENGPTDVAQSIAHTAADGEAAEQIAATPAVAECAGPHKTWGRAFGLALCYAAGGIAMGALYLLYCVATHSLGDFLYTQLDWNVKYAQTEFNWSALNARYVYGIFCNRWDEHFHNCSELNVALWAGLAGLILSLLLRQRVSARACWIWGLGFFTTVLTLFIQLKFFNYHFWPWLPFLALALAVGMQPLIYFWSGLWRFTRNLPGSQLERLVLSLLCLSLPLICLVPVYIRSDTALNELRKRQKRALAYLQRHESREKFYDRFKFHHIFDPYEDWLVVDKIAKLNKSKQPLKLYVWAFRPAIYYLSGVTGPSPFPYNLPLRTSWSPQNWLQDEEQRVMQDPPDFVVIGEFDMTPWITRNPHTSKQDTPPWLQQYLREHCERVETHKHSHLWHRVR